VVQRDHSYFRYISGNFSPQLPLISYCRDGWPEKSKLDEKLRPYWTMQGEFTVHDNLLFKIKSILFCITTSTNAFISFSKSVSDCDIFSTGALDSVSAMLRYFSATCDKTKNCARIGPYRENLLYMIIYCSNAQE
jgi:hypothetical protein